jgi:hypothetical protein
VKNTSLERRSGDPVFQDFKLSQEIRARPQRFFKI